MLITQSDKGRMLMGKISAKLKKIFASKKKTAEEESTE